MHVILGYAMIFSGFCFWVIGMYSCFVSKLFMPHCGHLILDWIKDDKYYCALVPAWTLFICCMMAVNWFSMKFFRHT